MIQNPILRIWWWNFQMWCWWCCYILCHELSPISAHSLLKTFCILWWSKHIFWITLDRRGILVFSIIIFVNLGDVEPLWYPLNMLWIFVNIFAIFVQISSSKYYGVSSTYYEMCLNTRKVTNIDGKDGPAMSKLILMVFLRSQAFPNLCM